MMSCSGGSGSIINWGQNWSSEGLKATGSELNNSTFVFSSVQSLSQVRLCDPMIAAYQGSLSITNSQSSLRLTSIESVMPSSHLILCRPLLLLPEIPPSIKVFSNESTLRMRWPKYWSLSFSIIPSKEHPGPISYRMDWLDLLAVQGTLKSLLQHHSSKVSILQCSAFFMVQHSHLQGAYLCPRDYRLSNSKTELPPWSLFLVLSEMVWGNCWQYSFFQSQLLIRVSLAGIHTFVFPTSVPLLF